MTTLHIDNTVRDYATWKAVFDKFEQFRREHGVRKYRVSRQVDDPSRVSIDLDFDSRDDAERFGTALAQIWRTPQSQRELVGHATPVLLEVEEHDLSVAADVGSA
jgi:hypothetical protein